MPDEKKDTDDVAGAASPADDEEAPSGDALELDPAVDNPDREADPPPEVAELAAACVRFVATRYKGTLDFTPETLSFVDQWLRDARAEIALRPEAASLVQAASGAYLGEVIRRAFGARWVVGPDHAAWKLCMSTVYCSYNPIGMTREALLLGPAEGWGAHLELDPGEAEGVERRLGALPSADEEEYYAPTTRFDVLSIVVDTLRGAMRARGLGDVRFAPDDYA
jgi:hypothetical protein